MTKYTVRGKTYPHRAALKKHGGKWDTSNKQWVGVDRNTAPLWLTRAPGLIWLEELYFEVVARPPQREIKSYLKLIPVAAPLVWEGFKKWWFRKRIRQEKEVAELTVILNHNTVTQQTVFASECAAEHDPEIAELAEKLVIVLHKRYGPTRRHFDAKGDARSQKEIDNYRGSEAYDARINYRRVFKAHAQIVTKGGEKELEYLMQYLP